MKKSISSILKAAIPAALTAFLLAAAGCFSTDGAAKGATQVQETGTEKTVVEVEQGKLRGAVTENGVYTFKGVPYAEAKERFVPASPAQKWDGVRDATQYGKISPQMEFMSTNMVSEEVSSNACQNLNIWTPSPDKKKRAVMVWLHGGGFSSGSAQETPTYDGSNLSKKGDVVVVSVNHRLNILGYFDLSTYGEKYRYSGNAGIQDIVDALGWIKKNIASFGGDPENVTVFGESGGGAKVMALMTTPRAKGLFKRGIIESGSTDTMGVVFTKKEVAEYITEQTLKSLGITKDNIEEIQNVPYAKLLAAGEKVLANAGKELGVDGAFGPGTALMWEPVVDGDFMPTDPVTKDGFAEGGRGIPLLIGSNLNEWTSVPLLENAESEKAKLESYTEADILSEAKKTYGSKAEAVVAEYKKAYPNEKLYNALFIDTLIRLPIIKTTAHKADQNAGNVYSYIFTYGAPFNFHTFELPYVFDNPKTSVMGKTNTNQETDIKVAEIMSSVWLAFAKTGNPSTAETGNWEPYTRASGSVMLLGEKNGLVHHHDENLLKLLAPEYKW